MCVFVGSADSGIADQTEMSAEMRVLQEVMDTETVYVADLEEVIEVIMDLILFTILAKAFFTAKLKL